MVPRGFCACASAIVLLLSDSAFAQKTKDIRAVVQEVDTTVGTITVVIGAGQVKTFNLARADLPVTDFAGTAVKLKTLQPDDRVFLTTSADESVTAIRVAPPTLFGVLVRIDAAKRTLVLRMNMEEKEVLLGTDVKILGSSGAIPLKELKAGQNVLIAYSPEKTGVVEVKTGAIAKPFARPTKRTGTLIDIDAGKKSLAILGVSSPQGDHAPLRHFKLTQDATCSLLYHGKAIGPLPLEYVVRGVKVSYWADPATKKIVHLQIDMPTLANRRVKSIDAAERRLVIEELESERTLMLAPTVKLLAAPGTGKLEDIRPGTLVHCGLRPDRMTVEVLQILPR